LSDGTAPSVLERGERKEERKAGENAVPFKGLERKSFEPDDREGSIRMPVQTLDGLGWKDKGVKNRGGRSSSSLTLGTGRFL